MKINCHIDSSLEEEYADIWIKEMTPQINQLLKALNHSHGILWCTHESQVIPIYYTDIFAIETTGHGLIVSTVDATYSYKGSLSALKHLLPTDFLDASRSAIFNYNHIDHLELQDNGSIDVFLKNQQRIQMSRRKIKNLKERLGI